MDSVTSGEAVVGHGGDPSIPNGDGCSQDSEQNNEAGKYSKSDQTSAGQIHPVVDLHKFETN